MKTGAGGKRWVLTAAILVAGIRLWMQVRGKTKTPFAEWAVGWGALFFFLAMASDAYPQAAGALASTVVVGDFLANGAGLFEDITGVMTGATGGQTFVSNPFAASSTSSASSSPASSAPTTSPPGKRGVFDLPGGGVGRFEPPSHLPHPAP